jgi:hypothetical protein
LLSEEVLSADLPSELFDVSDFAPFVFCGASLFALAPAVSFADGLEFAESSERLGGGWSEAGVLRGELLSEAWLLLAERGGAAGSGAGGSVLEGSAGRLLSTIAAKLEESCDGSGRAGFGGAFW